MFTIEKIKAKLFYYQHELTNPSLSFDHNAFRI